MKFAVITSLALGLSFAASSAATATDLYVPPADPMTPGSYDDGDPWNGFYFGAFKAFYIEPGDTAFGKGVDVGFNIVAGNILFGAEAKFYFLAFVPLDGIDEGLLDVEGRIGLLVSPDLLIYASGGAGAVVLGGSVDYWLLGGGVEFHGDNSLSWDAEYQAKLYGGGFVGHLFTVGANLHF